METAYNPSGLTSEQVIAKLREFGPNEIKDTSSNSIGKILIGLIRKNFIVYLLLIGATVSFFVGEIITSYAILAVIGLILVISFFQEYRAEKAIQALKSMIMPKSVVIRNGKTVEISSKDLVPGDVVILRMGERVPADCLVIEQNELQVNESILTGESREVKKVNTQDFAKFDESNVILMGSFIVSGRCQGFVIKTGMNTQFGSIANLITTTEKSLPLQDKVNSIAKYMVYAAIVISLLTGFFMALRVEVWTAAAVSSILILMISLAVSAFPEGLPVVLVTSLAVGATRMAKQNAIVNRMSIIETLGETTVICTDKTGTITTGEMTAQTIWLADKTIEINNKFAINNDPSLEMLLKSAVICNDAKIEKTGTTNEYQTLGTPTESSLLVMAAKAELYPEDIDGQRIEEKSFNSSRKMMSVLFQKNTETSIYAKGALEVLLPICSHIQRGDKVEKLTEEEKEKIHQLNIKYTKDTYRTIALAYKPTTDTKEYSEEGLIFLGFVAIIDPPRPEVAESIKTCLKAGIAVKLITGDHLETAIAVGRKVGIVGEAITGDDLDKLSDTELSKIILQTEIFARVRPEHKLRLVRILKQLGEIVTMTGDGVNDAPALKEAHIGVAMGKNGTDVSRSVADLTLKDDDFSTIVIAIKEGRTIFNNIRKFVSYQLSCSWAELAVLLLGVIFAPLFGWQIPIILALQILFMNLITDDFPAITLGVNHSSYDVMGDKPIKHASIINKESIIFMTISTTAVALISLASYYYSFNILGQDATTSRTVAMATMILLEIGNAFNFRSFRHTVIGRSLFINPYLFWASLVSIMATLVVIYTPLNHIFEITALSLNQWIIPAVGLVLIILLFDLIKLLRPKHHENFLSATS